MAKATTSNTFGPLVPDAWNDKLFTLHRFSKLSAFKSKRKPSLEANERRWVDAWEDHLAELAKVVRKFGVRAALHTKDVFEVYVQVKDDDGPSNEQATTYRNFVELEDVISDRVIDALIRYYHIAREEVPDAFEEDDPPVTNLSDLVKVVEFDCMTVRNGVVDGLCPIVLSWRPDWDEEHGLRVLVYDGQVVLIGTDEVSDAVDGYLDEDFLSRWAPNLTPDEQGALERFRSNVNEADEDEW